MIPSVAKGAGKQAVTHCKERREDHFWGKLHNIICIFDLPDSHPEIYPKGIFSEVCKEANRELLVEAA